MKTLVYILVALVICSCGSSKSSDIGNCKEIAIKQRHFVPMGSKGPGDSDMFYSYAHYLMLTDFNEECLDQYDFVYAADIYLDTVKTNLPVGSISFSKPFDFRPSGDLTDGDQFTDNAILEIWYDIDRHSPVGKLPEIHSVRFLYQGRHYGASELPVSRRQVRLNYLHDKQQNSSK